MRSMLPTDQCQAMARPPGDRGSLSTVVLSIDCSPNTWNTPLPASCRPPKNSVRSAVGPLHLSIVFCLLLLFGCWLFVVPTIATATLLHNGINQTDAPTAEGKLPLLVLSPCCLLAIYKFAITHTHQLSLSLFLSQLPSRSLLARPRVKRA